jgi:hypothetical protein
LQLLTLETFASHLNSTSALKLGESSLDLTLTQATKQPVLPSCRATILGAEQRKQR